MTENPPPRVVQPPTIGGPLVPSDQAPAPPPAEEAPPGDGMRFIVRFQDNPDLSDHNQPKSLYRFKITEDEVVTDRFDITARMWVDNPAGIDGADDFEEIDIDNANALISQWLEQSFISEKSSEEGVGGEEGSDDGLAQQIFRSYVQAYQQIAARNEEGPSEPDVSDQAPPAESEDKAAYSDESPKKEKKKKRKKKRKKKKGKSNK